MNPSFAVQEIQKRFNVHGIYANRVLGATKTENYLDEAAQILARKPKPFVKWVGGKRQLISQFKELGVLPPQGFDQSKNTYHEPFVGGGAVFFELLPNHAVLSDMNHELVITYNVIRDDVEALIKELTNGRYLYDKEVFSTIRATQPVDIWEIEIAARFIYLNRTAFNGMYRVNSSGEYNVPFGTYTNPIICDEVNLRSVSRVLKGVHVKQQDYRSVLNTARSGDFVYFDPPYYPVSKTASFTAYTPGVFLEKEQEELRDTFIELHRRGCFVSLSNSDTPFIESLYSPYKKEGVAIRKVQAGRAINSNAEKRGKVSELLVTNYA